MLNLAQLPVENLRKIEKVVRIILDNIDLQETKGLIKIPLEKFENEKLDYYEVVGTIDKMKEIVNQLNKSFKYDLRQYSLNQNEYITGRYGELIMKGLKTKNDYLSFYNISEEDLKKYIILEIKDLDELKEIDKKIRERNKIYTEELIRQLGEVRKTPVVKQEVIEKVYKTTEKSREAVERMLKNPSVAQAYKSYIEMLKRVSEQLTPTKEILKRVYDLKLWEKIHYDAIISAFQSLAKPLKRFEKQMEEAKKIYPIQRDTLIDIPRSPQVYIVKQQSSMISNIRRIEELVKKLTEKESQMRAKQKITTGVRRKRGKIRKITLIKTRGKEYMVAINNNYDEAKKIPEWSEWWKIFIKEIENREKPENEREGVKEIPKEMAEYFNYNKKCGLYFGGKYELTNIFEGHGADISINPEVETEIITERTFKRRLQQSKKK